MQDTFASGIPFLVQAASNRGKGERKVEWIACHRENDASVLHDVHRAIVSLPEKREPYAWSGGRVDEKLHCAPEFWNFFPNFFATRRFTEINGCEPDMEKREIDEF